GATMASAEFADDSEEKRPTVQVGDPFTEKLLLEACLELMATDAIIAIQDMGAAGLTSSSVEMSSKGGVGIDLDLDAVPMRESEMSAYEVMLSESQERMLMVLKPEREAEARAIFDKWELDFAVIGRITDTGRLIVRKDGELCADIPVDPLVSHSPVYDRPYEKTEAPAILETADIPLAEPVPRSLMRLLSCPDLASRRWIWEQYDYLVRGESVIRPGGDAGIVRIEGSEKALAMTTDCTPRYCVTDPATGGRQAVAEAYRNLCAVGARPLAVTNNLNFGNPERPSVMGQLVGCIEGMGEACRALDFPVVSGNVSLYNETNGKGILPTPVIGGVGLIEDWRQVAGIAPADGDELVVIGADGEAPAGWLGASLYLREIVGREDGAPPPVDLETERRNGELVRALIAGDTASAVHDISDGGLLVALAEMALAGDVGMSLARWHENAPAHGFWFGEDQGRYVVSSSAPDAVLAAARDAGARAAVIGRAGGDKLTVDGAEPISIADLRRAHESWLPAYMATP
ncbi:MAG: phosphoribosylformylglycinamidine synthase subunit PurL, partial [Alphaproteobacteria bacterium]